MIKNFIFIISLFILSCSNKFNKNYKDYNVINSKNNTKINEFKEKYKVVNLLCKDQKKNMYIVIFKRKKNGNLYIDKENFSNLKHNFKFLIKCVQDYIGLEKKIK